MTCSNLDYLDTDYLDGLVFYGIKFIVGDSSNYLSLSQVNSGTGNPLYRITAQSQISTGLGILTLNPFQSPDDGLLIGCVGLYQSSEGSDYVNKETTNLQAAGIVSDNFLYIKYIYYSEQDLEIVLSY